MSTGPSHRILISGASGTIGVAARAEFVRRGWSVLALSRGRPGGMGDISWDPEGCILDQDGLLRFAPTVVLHLAGESVFGRFTRRKKARILQSRVLGTRVLARAVERLPSPPSVFLSASAVGYYGDTGDREADEAAPAGDGFLAEVCRAWELEASPVASAGIRNSTLRIGVVLSPSGGALATMLPVFRAGLGGPIAGGRAWVPWISLHDAVAAIVHIIETVSLSGPVNIVGPRPVPQRELARELGVLLRRPAIVPVPGWVLAGLLGEFARETALKSVRAVPTKLVASGFRFRHGTVAEALAAAVGGQSCEPPARGPALATRDTQDTPASTGVP